MKEGSFKLVVMVTLGYVRALRVKLNIFPYLNATRHTGVQEGIHISIHTYTHMYTRIRTFTHTHIYRDNRHTYIDIYTHVHTKSYIHT